MVSHIYVTACVVIALTLTSLFFLAHLALNQSQHLMQSSKSRFYLFLCIHLFVVAMMVLLVMLSRTFSLVKWAFGLSFTIAFSSTALEIVLHCLRVNNNAYSIRTVMPAELAYLNCYFLVYMYSLICCFLTSTFLLLTHCCICMHDYRIRRAIRESIHTISYGPAMEDQLCSICITKLGSEEQLLQIKCKHIFHQDCLLEWIRINQTCPTCRFNVFEALNREDVGVEIIRNPNPAP